MNGVNEYLRLSSWNDRLLKLPREELLKELESCSRETLIEWLRWNDPNGIYTDELSMKEFGNVMGREEGE